MSNVGKLGLPVLSPKLSISFQQRLRDLSRLHLEEALKSTIRKIDITELNQQLDEIVESSVIRKIASFGLSAEIVVPAVCLSECNRILSGYYRLLYGISQKKFYHRDASSEFKRMDVRGEIPL